MLVGCGNCMYFDKAIQKIGICLLNGQKTTSQDHCKKWRKKK